MEESESAEPYTVIFHVSTCDESYVETDLEIEEFINQSILDKTTLPEYDETGCTYYISECKKCDIVPCDKYLRNILEETLDIPHYGLGEKGIVPLSESLKYNKTIKYINLCDNYLGDVGIGSFISMLHFNETITEINLSFNKLTSACTAILSETLANSPNLTKLNLSHNLFDDKSALNFGELMILSLNLEYLNLSYNHFNKGALIPFGKAFLQTTSIKHLDLSFNGLGSLEKNPINKFITGLTKNSCFKILDLSNNSFGTNHALLGFGKVLKLNSTIEELNLNNNRINTESIVKFAKQLHLTKSLKILRIGLNPILSAGAYSILNYSLKHPNPPFKMFDFESVDVNDEFRLLESQLLIKIPDIIVLTGVRLVDRVISTVDPLYRFKLLSQKLDIKIIDFFIKYIPYEDANYIDLNNVPEILDDFCIEYDFNLLEFDKNRIYKLFPRTEERLLKLKVIANIFNEEYTDDEETIEEPVKIEEQQTQVQVVEDELFIKINSSK